MNSEVKVPVPKLEAKAYYFDYETTTILSETIVYKFISRHKHSNNHFQTNVEKLN